jgi:hypothetical protein
VEADSNNGDTDTDQVLIKNGTLFLREGDGLVSPSGATIDSFDSINLNNAGNSGWNFFLNSGLPSSEDSGVYFNTSLLIQESNVSTAPEFTPGTPYIGFFDVKMNDMNRVLIVASVDDPDIDSSVDRALVLLTLDGSGNLLSESVLFKENDLLPGQTEIVDDFGTGPHESDFNERSQVLFFANLAGDTSADGAIYLDSTLLAQEGAPSPVAGRLYQFLSSRGRALNNRGQVFFKANLDGATADDEILVFNGAVFMREGGSPAAIAPFALTSFGTGSGPVDVDDMGNKLWYGDWNDPDTDRDTGLFLNEQLIVQEGVSTVGGVVIDTISSGSDAFELSDNGQWVIFEATLDDGTNGAYIMQISQGENIPPVALCQDAVVEAPAGACEADASVDAGSFDPDGGAVTLAQVPSGPYPVGTTPVTLIVTDDQGAVDSCTATITVLDVTPPSLSVTATPDSLWPPNHRLEDVTVTATAGDLCGSVAVVLESVASDEPDNGEGDGNTVNDIQDADVGTADFDLRLRAERSGQGDGRVYTLVYTATDASGNTTSAGTAVTVAHDQGGVVEPLNLQLSAATGTVISWPEVQGAQAYSVVRGDLASVVEMDNHYDLGWVKCLQNTSSEPDTAGQEDLDLPEPGSAFFYLVEYHHGSSDSGFGTESAAKPRLIGANGCD